MNRLFTLFLYLLPALISAQAVDSIAIRQVDSLIQVSRALTAKNNFEQALEVNAAAEKIALEKLGRESAAFGNCCFNHGRVLDFNRDYTESEKWYLEAKAIREKILGKEHPDYASSLNNLALLYSNMGNYEKAEPLYLESKTIREKILGKEHPDYVQSLNNLANLYQTMGLYPKAELLFLESKAIREKNLGKEHPNYVQSLNNLANLYSKMSRYDKAEPYYMEIKAIREKNLGKEHPDYIKSLNSLARLYIYMGRYANAESLYLEARAIREKTLGKEHPDYAQSLDNLAGIYYYMGRYEKGESLALDAKAILEKNLGREHPNYAISLTTLANLYTRMGRYDETESLYLEVKAIEEKTFGKDHPSYAISLNNLASHYMETMGRYDKAEPLFLEAKAIWGKNRGDENPYSAGCLNNLADMYSDMGNYDKAEPLFLEAKTIWEKTLGKDHPIYAQSLDNLASLYSNTNRYDKAELLNLESKVVREKALGKENPDYAKSLNNLANLYIDIGRYDKAEPLNLEAKAIREKALGKEHPDYAKSLNSLANLYRAMGRYEKAEPLSLEAKAIREKVLGKEHPDHAESLNDLALLYSDMGRYDKAEPLFHELSATNKLLIGRATQHLSEKELNNYLRKFSHLQDRTLSFSQKTGSEKLIPTCYDNSLFYKGFLLQASDRVKRLALQDERATENYNRLKGYQRRLAAQYTLPIAERDGVLIAELEAYADEIEKELARTVAGWGEAKRQVQWQDVQAALPKEAAAVEFVHYRYYEKKATDSTMYAALVLRLGAEQPKFIPLFEEKQLDSLLRTKGDRKADYVNNLYAVAERGVRPIDTPQKSLYELIWQPLEQELGDVKTVFFSPTGLLHRLNLSAIPILDEETIGQRYQLTHLNSTRRLVIPTKLETAAQDAVLLGGIEYEMDTAAIALANKNFDNDAIATQGALSFSYADSTNRLAYRGYGEGRSIAWNYLKWTDKEVDKVETILIKAGFQTDTRKGYAATEESCKAVGRNRPSPRILHFATHGFFFPDTKEALSAGSGSAAAEPVFKIADHPMIRSGLLLAGANHAWFTGKPFREGMEDGILTAYEISQMNLSNTELVVLSACETGLGDIKDNEGVYGLQRAFKIAGAKYLIMSLWQVPDYQTQELMTSFYSKWLENKMAIPEAFYSAQQEMRDKYQNPFFWAGFVLVE